MVNRTAATIQGTGLGGAGIRYDAIRRNCRHGETCGELSPREIVAGLHAEIAGKSPEHAALVAAYQDTRAARKIPAGQPQVFPRSPYQPRRLRLAAYTALREAGNTPKAARLALGICPRTAVRYEAAMKEGRA